MRHGARCMIFASTPASGKVTVLQQATITQATGEDWTNCRAEALDPPRPARGIAPPTLQPMRVALTDPRRSVAQCVFSQRRARATTSQRSFGRPGGPDEA